MATNAEIRIACLTHRINDIEKKHVEYCEKLERKGLSSVQLKVLKAQIAEDEREIDAIRKEIEKIKKGRTTTASKSKFTEPKYDTYVDHAGKPRVTNPIEDEDDMRDMYSDTE